MIALPAHLEPLPTRPSLVVSTSLGLTYVYVTRPSRLRRPTHTSASVARVPWSIPTPGPDMSASRSSHASHPAETLIGSERGVLLNDLHSQLNPTRVDSVVSVTTVGDVQNVVRRAAQRGKAVSIFGGRHAMGAQQFATDGIAIDTRGLNAIGDLDS